MIVVVRTWDHKTRRWYYHSSPSVVMSEHTGHTGGVVVVILIVLLSLYSLHRIWVVWAYTLNFDGVTTAWQTFLLISSIFRPRVTRAGTSWCSGSWTWSG